MLRWMIGVSLAMSTTAAVARPADLQGTVYLNWTHGARPYVIVDETLWRCDGDRCVGPVSGSLTQAARICRLLRRSGEVKRFVLPSGELSAEQLQRCNR